jgi:hypothetical protein
MKRRKYVIGTDFEDGDVNEDELVANVNGWSTYDEEYDLEENIMDNCDFQDPGGDSALRRATEGNPRNLPCPNCGRVNMLTPLDAILGYQCDICADEQEGGYLFRRQR